MFVSIINYVLEVLFQDSDRQQLVLVIINAELVEESLPPHYNVASLSGVEVKQLINLFSWHSVQRWIISDITKMVVIKKKVKEKRFCSTKKIAEYKTFTINGGTFHGK